MELETVCRHVDERIRRGAALTMTVPAAIAGPLAAAPVLRTFSHGRNALLAALQLCDLRAGDAVLLPGYICQEVLAPVAASGARALFYGVNEGLEPAQEWCDWPAARVVVAVNYFGFAQNLAPFRQYCTRHGAVLIEDNAHGWLSREAGGEWLGLRGDLGIFSMHKTLRLIDGAALAVLRADLAAHPPPQLPPRHLAMPVTLRVERWLAELPGPLPLFWVRTMRREWRQWRSGSAVPPPSARAETDMPSEAAPHAGLQAALDGFDAPTEVLRRRALYGEVHARLAPFGVTPLWRDLPVGTAPYGYAFRAAALAGHEKTVLVRAMRRMGLEVFLWPALPSAVAPVAPAHYSNTWLVNFL